MCHRTRHKYNCGHKIETPPVHCPFHAVPSVIHAVSKRDLQVAAPCPSCAMSTGQEMVFPWQVDSPPVQLYTPQAQVQAQPRIIYQPQPPPQFQYQYQTYTPAQTYTAPQLIPGPGSGGTALPVPGGIPQSTRMEWRGGRWCPVTHYHFPSSATPTTTYPSTAATGATAGYIPPPAQVQVAARPPGIPPNQGWSRVHGVDPGPPPPGPPPAPVSSGNGSGSGGVSFGGNGGHFSGVSTSGSSGNGDDGSGWGNFWPAGGVGLSPVQAQDPVAAQPQPPASSTAPQVPSSAVSFSTPSSTSTTSPSTSSTPAPTATATSTSGPPAAILAAAAAQAPLPSQPANPIPANVAARNARAESLLRMGSSGLARLTAANTAANAAANLSWNGGVGMGRPAST